MTPTVNLAELTTLGLGGPPQELVVAQSEAELVAAVREADFRALPLLLIGGGSNLVISDDGFPGRAVVVATQGVAVHGDLVTAAAGESWDGLVAQAVADGRAGIEALAGIPGSVGATPIQNVGAYGQEVAQTLEQVRVLDRYTGQIRTLPAAACEFSYRNSRFKRRVGREVVLAVTFRLPAGGLSTLRYAELAAALRSKVGDSAPPADVRAAVLALRRGKGMVLDNEDVDTRSVGSFFTNPVVTPELAADVGRRAGAAPPQWPERNGLVKLSAAWLVEHSGFARGYGPGHVRISTKHTLALTHPGGGTTAELIALAREIRVGVRERLGVDLQVEPTLVGVTL